VNKMKLMQTLLMAFGIACFLTVSLTIGNELAGTIQAVKEHKELILEVGR